MLKWMLLWGCAMLCAVGAQMTPDAQEPKSYSGYSVIRTESLNKDELVEALLTLDATEGVHFWKYPLANRTFGSDILVSPEQAERVGRFLDLLGVEHRTIIHDVDVLLQQEQTPLFYDAINNEVDNENQAETKQSTSNSLFFQRYQRYDAIMKFAKQLAQEDSRVSYERIGISSEGREIGLVKISSGGNKKAIWIDGGMHAREWISPATVTYIMNKLVKDSSGRNLVDKFDFYIVPIINVDGYEYSHTRDRMWRKTRSRRNSRCVGVDPNRNWGFHWAESGSSSNPCSDVYHGPKAFSEPETAYVARAIKARSNILLYLTFHSYSQLWLLPYGYRKYARPADYNQLLRLARVGQNALTRTYGTQYRVGTAPDLLYPAAGGSDDWAKGGAGIKYSYCLELRDKGRYGFLLPANQIQATGEETFNGVAAMANALYTKRDTF